MTDCDQFWRVFRYQVAMHITQVMDGVYLHVARAHVQMCPYFGISGMAGRIGLKFDVWLGYH